MTATEIVDAVVNTGGYPFELIEHAIDHVGEDRTDNRVREGEQTCQ